MSDDGVTPREDRHAYSCLTVREETQKTAAAVMWSKK